LASNGNLFSALSFSDISTFSFDAKGQS